MIKFHLNKIRNHKIAKRFFKQILRPLHFSKPLIITVDTHPVYLIASKKLKKEKPMHVFCASSN
ncbi:DDE-type integrase/transposase/recombinase, partial [Bacillus cereus]|uniref:DDE-type integrase/transposase/recombinase n=1 Tax=Bacillus cereus TaxID=1396 RepID=UPI001593DE08